MRKTSVGKLIGFFYAILAIFILISSHSCIKKSAKLASSPYPPSPVITGITWDFANILRAAPGSDLWPVSWADDGRIYTAWGDGGGFGGTNTIGRVSIGVARIENFVGNLRYENIFGGVNSNAPATFPGKPTGMICIDGVLYMGVAEEDNWVRWKIGRSTDYGMTWKFNGTSFDSYWDFAEPDGAFAATAFLNFGKDYQGARDDYVYAYSPEGIAENPYDAGKKGVGMFRVPKDKIMDRNEYEYFAGMDGNNNPQWTKDLTLRKPAFSDPNGVGEVQVVFNPALRRYLLTTWHAKNGSWGIFDAAEPWGPWTTVAYYEKWIDSTFKFGFTFPQKWMSIDGKTMYMIFSGTKIYDSFNVIKAMLTVNKAN